MRKGAIIGAGISGLSLAWYLQQKGGWDVTLYEQSDRVGGAIQTLHKNDFLFEKGPRSLRTRGSGIETLKLVEALGLQDQVIGSQTLSRYLYLNKKMQKVPQNLLSFLTSPLTRPHLFTFLKEFWRPKGELEDETIYDFAKRRYSKAVAETFFDPLVSGVFGGDMEQLSLRACFPTLHQFEQEKGSLLKGMMFSKKEQQKMSPFVQEMQKFPLFSFKKGLETLPIELGKRVKTQFGKKVNKIQCDSTSATLTFTDNSQTEVDHVFCAIPLDGIISPLKLPPLPRASLAAVHLGYRQEKLPYQGFGYLVPRSEKERVLGVVFDSSVFPAQQNGNLSLTVMIGGAKMPHFENHTPEEFIDWALEGVQRHLGIQSTPDVIECSRHLRAIPQYPMGYQQSVKTIERLTLLGNSYHGVAVNDCIAHSLAISS